MTQGIATRTEFLTFLSALRSDFTERPDKWENQDLAAFLEAMEAWIADMDGYYSKIGREMPVQPTWQMLADILNGARVYE